MCSSVAFIPCASVDMESAVYADAVGRTLHIYIYIYRAQMHDPQKERCIYVTKGCNISFVVWLFGCKTGNLQTSNIFNNQPTAVDVVARAAFVFR